MKYIACSEFHPHPYTVRYALDHPMMRPWLRFRSWRLFHDVDQSVSGFC